MPPKKRAQPAKSLEATLWDAADELRGKMDSAQYKHVVLGLIFLKYVSDTFMVRHRELARLVDDPESDYFMPNDAAKRSVLEDRDEYTAEGVFWIPEGHRWDDLRKAAKQPDIGKRVDDAMEAIERENPTLKGVLPKNYTQRELSPENIGGLIDTFSRQDLAAEEYKGLDVLGRVYEYFLGQFASNEGKKAGEFYTPRSVVELLVEMLQPVAALHLHQQADLGVGGGDVVLDRVEHCRPPEGRADTPDTLRRIAAVADQLARLFRGLDHRHQHGAGTHVEDLLDHPGLAQRHPDHRLGPARRQCRQLRPDRTQVVRAGSRSGFRPPAGAV